MDEARVNALTEGQRACLRLVGQAMTSKEIALRLGVSPHTVDQRLRVAMRTLGAASRIEAARHLARCEHGPVYQPLAYQSPAIALRQHAATMSGPAAEWRQDDHGPEMMGEAQARFEDAIGSARYHLPLPVPTGGRTRNDLEPLQKIIWIVLIAILSALAFGALLSGMQGLASLFGWLN